MTDKARGTPLINHLLLILMGVMLVYLVVSFARQVSVGYQRSEELRRVEQEIDAAADEYSRLQALLVSVRSKNALDNWGRRHAMIRQNEVLVVPVGGQSQSPSAELASEKGEDVESPHDAWWDLFFRAR
jgi:hypothetical protein